MLLKQEITDAASGPVGAKASAVLDVENFDAPANGLDDCFL